MVFGLLFASTGTFVVPAGGADFDRNGCADLAIGVQEGVFGFDAAGAVNILYGTADGTSASGDQIWVQEDLAAGDGSEFKDKFGKTLAAGDFNGDGAADLAVGVPGESIVALSNCGAVYVLYGVHSIGLGIPDHQFWHQGPPDLAGATEIGDQFGSALAIGDFDGDGFDDLAVGAPHEDANSANDAGAVNVLYGSSAGLSAEGNQYWYEGQNDLVGTTEPADNFGSALAAGDFDRDGFDDLAISIPGEDLGGVDNAGRVVVLYGTSTGLSATHSQAWVQGLGEMQNLFETDDRMGETLATGDFNGDGFSDLAIGVPHENWSSTINAGAVHVLFGSEDGLTADGNELWTDDDPKEEDLYGLALATGDFDANSFDELVIGIPFRTLGSATAAGAVEILRGGSEGLFRRTFFFPPFEIWHQNMIDVLDDAERHDWFGWALAASDFNGDGYSDLAVGVPGEDVDSINNAGAVQIFYGSSNGITDMGNQFWHQNSPNVNDEAELADEFGSALAAIPGFNVVFLDNFETGDTSRWSNTQP